MCVFIFYFLLYTINLLISESSHLAQPQFASPKFIILQENKQKQKCEFCGFNF